MNRLFFPALFLTILTVACGHSPFRVSSQASSGASFAPSLLREASDIEQITLKPEASLNTAPSKLSATFLQMTAKSGDESARSQESLQEEGEEEATIADPLEPFNRAMFQLLLGAETRSPGI
jgi:arginase family enzyme